MGVDLGGRDVGMAQHLLHAPEIGAMCQKMGRESVSQYMWREAVRINARDRRERLQQLPAAYPREMAGRAARWEEETRGLAFAQHRGPGGQPGFDRCPGGGADRDQPLLA